MRFWQKALIIVTVTVVLMIIPTTRMLLIMIAPIGVKPDDIVVLGLIIFLSIYYFVHKRKQKKKTKKNLVEHVGSMSTEQKRILIEKAERREKLRENLLTTADMLIDIPSKYPIREAAIRLSRNLILLRTFDDDIWDSNQNLRRLATYYCDTIDNVYNAWLSNKKDKEFTTKVIGLFNDIADAAGKLANEAWKGTLTSAEIDIEVANNQLFQNFGIKEKQE